MQDHSASSRPIVIVSNRGPISFTQIDGELVSRRGAGGLVSGLAPLVCDTDTMWIAAAISDGDRRAAAEGVIETDGFRVRTVAMDPDRYRLAYDVVCNATLWFLHHGLWDLPSAPNFGARFHQAWDAYRSMNRAFADVVIAEAPRSAIVLVQDYHLALLASLASGRRQDLCFVHFSHTPFAGPDLCRVLPTAVATELLDGMADHAACGFHTRRWASSFDDSSREITGRTAQTFVAPLGPDTDDLAATVQSQSCRSAFAELDRTIGERNFIVRVDRIELSKNVVRGFQAYDDLLDRYPRWRGEVVFGAFVYPSRESLPEYAAYRRSVDEAVAAINARWSTADWTPIMYDPSDDYPRSVGALRRADVLLVNPIRDGLNLVAKEGPLVNERDAALVLSTEAGAWAELDGTALGVNPFDIAQTADRLHEALSMTAGERSVHADKVRELAGARTPADWLEANLAAASQAG